MLVLALAVLLTGLLACTWSARDHNVSLREWLDRLR